jgi:sulfhydrogenase subunit beta (sulfur reductase)
MQIDNYRFQKASLEKLFNNLIGNGKTVYAPKAGEKRVLFEEVKTYGEITGNYIVTTNTAKIVVFPRVEKLFSFKKTKEKTEISDASTDSFSEVVLWGTRPCDAAAFIPLTDTFNGDYPDVLFNNRREKVYLLSFSCSVCDEYCFCTSVNGGPGNTNGSDILFTRLSTDDYLAEVMTEKGRQLVGENQSLFEAAPSEAKEPNLAKVTAYFSLDEIHAKLQGLFESPVWNEKSRACLGCGSCAFVCPVCSCFDIQDEKHGCKGARLRCWDSCGFKLFTQHTSGHNPRPTQGARWRQRILHKFLYMPDKTNIAGCVGCGRCSRSCPADINILDTMTSI